MRGRVLEIALCGSGSIADESATVIANTASRLLVDREHTRVQVNRLSTDSPDEVAASGHHLVVVVGSNDSTWSDTGVATVAEAERLATDRLVPWVSRWQEGRRAPRAQTAVLSDSDSEWSSTAARLIARLRASTGGESVLRIDHIGSTSVPGLAAKNLIDLQISVPRSHDAVAVAQAATGAGFVHVAGEWFGKDRHGHVHPEQVCVDADPARPVNINIRSVDQPVARDR